MDNDEKALGILSSGVDPIEVTRRIEAKDRGFLLTKLIPEVHYSFSFSAGGHSIESVFLPGGETEKLIIDGEECKALGNMNMASILEKAGFGPIDGIFAPIPSERTERNRFLSSPEAREERKALDYIDGEERRKKDREEKEKAEKARIRKEKAEERKRDERFSSSAVLECSILFEKEKRKGRKVQEPAFYYMTLENQDRDKRRYEVCHIQGRDGRYDFRSAAGECRKSIEGILKGYSGYGFVLTDTELNRIMNELSKGNPYSFTIIRKEKEERKLLETGDGAMTKEECCRLLSIPLDAKKRSIETAYKKQLLKYHSDTYASLDIPKPLVELAEERTKKIIEAHDTLIRLYLDEGSE
ncbi:MAG: hypothetical protein SPJ34_02645 [Candidatus Ornithospirochaeta sp.]|nr:hypothetical protein [Candidatus Ornithospirochaeta sp.]